MIDIVAPAMLAAAIAAAPGPAASQDREILACLALNVYHEARSEGPEGRAAVAHVTLNRVGSGSFPDDVCGVVRQSAGGRCQFSWTCDGRSDAPRNAGAFARSMDAAARALAGLSRDPTGGALYFLPTRLGKPSWARRLTETRVIEGHRFFR